MRAEFKAIPEGTVAPPIVLLCNSIEPVYVEPRLASKKYKKVGKEVKSKLLRCIQNGWSIINVTIILPRLLNDSTSTTRQPSRLFKASKERDLGVMIHMMSGSLKNKKVTNKKYEYQNDHCFCLSLFDY